MGKNYNTKAASSPANQTTPAPTQAPVAKPVVEEQAQQTTETNVEVTETTTTTTTTEEKDIVIQPKVVEAPVSVSMAVEHKAVVIEEARAVVAENAVTTDQLEKILKDVPAAHQIEINRILMYIGRMGPDRLIDLKAALVEQVALYRAIQNIINRQDTYFTQLFTAVLFLFKEEYKGALGDRYRMRYMDNIALPEGDRKAFANITQMLLILSDPKSREIALKQVNMERALENGLTEEGRSRVLNYFNL